MNISDVTATIVGTNDNEWLDEYVSALRDASIDPATVEEINWSMRSAPDGQYANLASPEQRAEQTYHAYFTAEGRQYWLTVDLRRRPAESTATARPANLIALHIVTPETARRAGMAPLADPERLVPLGGRDHDWMRENGLAVCAGLGVSNEQIEIGGTAVRPVDVDLYNEIAAAVDPLSNVTR